MANAETESMFDDLHPAIHLLEMSNPDAQCSGTSMRKVFPAAFQLLIDWFRMGKDAR